MNFATKTQRGLTDERRAAAPAHITCFNYGSQGHRTVHCPKQLSKNGYPRRQDYQSRGSNPSHRHKAALVVPTDGSCKRKRASMEQIAEFRRNGQIPVASHSGYTILFRAIEGPVLKDLIYDLIIGNIAEAWNAHDLHPLWEHGACGETKKQAAAEGCTTPFKVAQKVHMDIIGPEKLVEMQTSDTTLDHCRDQEDPFEIKGKERSDAGTKSKKF
ncbi:hypothetical protein RRG08_012486 [Elysia crispata]|uniref:Uncharacterized protein n=1 Tax=Elysia crispata TaxID=231223 RepID=A0AAE1AP21_9GAST|nr:hypothetical protein RRG08_012486 [Elysia crispata]